MVLFNQIIQVFNGTMFCPLDKAVFFSLLKALVIEGALSVTTTFGSSNFFTNRLRESIGCLCVPFLRNQISKVKPSASMAHAQIMPFPLILMYVSSRFRE